MDLLSIPKLLNVAGVFILLLFFYSIVGIHLFAKVRSFGDTGDIVLEGITTTIDLHKKILRHKKFIDSDFDTNWLEKEKFF